MAGIDIEDADQTDHNGLVRVRAAAAEMLRRTEHLFVLLAAATHVRPLASRAKMGQKSKPIAVRRHLFSPTKSGTTSTREPLHAT
jgi:hypothetical protein